MTVMRLIPSSAPVAADPGERLDLTSGSADSIPGLAGLPDDVRAGVAEFVDAWADGYGPEARAIPAACHAWAGRVMLADLAPRYTASSRLLDPVRRSIDAASRR